MERRHQPRPGFREYQPGQPTAGQTCPRKVPNVITSAFPHNATEAPGSCPQRSGEALELSQVWLEALLPSQSWIRWENATSRHIKHWRGIPGFLRAPTICGQTMHPTWPSEELCYAGTKSARPSIAPSLEPQWGLTLIELLRPYYLGSGRRSRSDGRKLSIPSTSRTIVARRGEPSTNLLAGLDASFASAPSRQTPSPRNLWRTGYTGPGIASPPGWSTMSCPTYGRFQQLRVTVSPNPSGQKSLLLPSDAWSQESLRDWIPSSRSSYSTPVPSEISDFTPCTHAQSTYQIRW